MQWTTERIAALKQMWLAGLSASQVARQLGGVTRNAVIGKVHRMGLSGRDAPSRPRSVGARPAARLAAPPKRIASAPAPTRRVAAPPPAAVAPFEVAPSATLLSLGERACRWPIGDPDAVDFGFCGRVRSGAGSYCAGHAQIAFQAKARPKAREAAPLWLTSLLKAEAAVPQRHRA